MNETKKIKDCQFREAKFDEKENIIDSLEERPDRMKQKLYDAIKRGDFLILEATCSKVDGDDCYFDTEFKEHCKGKLKELETGNYEMNAGVSCKFVNVDDTIFVYLKEV